MKINSYQSAEEREIRSCRKEFMETMQFENFEEARNNLKVGDKVLAFHNLGRYVMKVTAIDYNSIQCTDNISYSYFRPTGTWYNNGIEKVIY